FDAFPKRVFKGKVAAVGNAPATIQNVVTYDTRIELEDVDPKFKPGMTGYASISIGPQKDASGVEGTPAAAAPYEAGAAEQVGGYTPTAPPPGMAPVQEIRSATVQEWFDRIGGEYSRTNGPFAAMWAL